MSNPSKRKGTTFERAVQDYFNAHHLEARRMPPAGAKDVGDLQTNDLVIECKATNSIQLASAVDEAVAEADIANLGVDEARNEYARIGIAVIKRRMHGVHDAYVVLRLQDFVRFFYG